MKRTFFCITVVAAVFTSCSSTQFAITSGDEHLSALTKVTDSEEPCINPYGGDNGQNLFYAAREGGRYFNIFKKENPFASASSQKTSGKNLNYQPFYSPAIDKIVFRCQNEGSSTSDIFMMAATNGKTLTQITESSNAYEGNPCISSDGKLLVYDKVAYSYARSMNLGSLLFGLGSNITMIENSEIWLRNLETGENILLGNGYQPRLSPDNKTIAYVKYASDAKSCGIWTMGLDGSNQVQITDAKKGYAHNPCWSPDGKRIVFQSLKKDKKDFDIYVINVNGDNLTQLTVNKSYDAEPYWTTDGYIYFVSDRGGKKGNYQIWRFKIDD